LTIYIFFYVAVHKECKLLKDHLPYFFSRPMGVLVVADRALLSNRRYYLMSLWKLKQLKQKTIFLYNHINII